jgi:hypothetical protein
VSGAQWLSSTFASLRTTLIFGSPGGGNKLFSSGRRPLFWLYQDGSEFLSHSP